MLRRGHSWPIVILQQLPQAACLRAWRLLAQRINARLVDSRRNTAKFGRFQDGLTQSKLPRFLVIVMPNTLHFLLPCVELLRGRAQLVFIANGAEKWELQFLAARLPDVPMFVLPTLPFSSAPHGELLSMLLTHHREDFGIIDHDAYVLDPHLLMKLKPEQGECMVGVFAQHSERTGLQYPLTHLLYFNTKALRLLMRRWRIDARQYPAAPPQVANAFVSLGLGTTSYLKDYHTFFDTLHVLLVVAISEGLSVRFEPPDADPPVIHIGGTSIGSHHTKDLFALYIHLRFLELLDEPLVRSRYDYMVRPLRTSDDALRMHNAGDPAWRNLPLVEKLMLRLAELRATDAN